MIGENCQLKRKEKAAEKNIKHKEKKHKTKAKKQKQNLERTIINKHKEIRVKCIYRALYTESQIDPFYIYVCLCVH